MHTHSGTINNIFKVTTIKDDFKVWAKIGIVRREKGFQNAKEWYPHRFVNTRYLSSSMCISKE